MCAFILIIMLIIIIVVAFKLPHLGMGQFGIDKERTTFYVYKPSSHLYNNIIIIIIVVQR